MFVRQVIESNLCYTAVAWSIDRPGAFLTHRLNPLLTTRSELVVSFR
jgi:hypothetical protein